MLVLYVISSGLVQVVQGNSNCTNEICVGDGFHCCNGYCCTDTDSVHIEWWFWFILSLLLFVCLLGIIRACWQYNKYRNREYLWIAEVRTSTTYNSVTPRPPPYSEVGT